MRERQFNHLDKLPYLKPQQCPDKYVEVVRYQDAEGLHQEWKLKRLMQRFNVTRIDRQPKRK